MYGTCGSESYFAKLSYPVPIRSVEFLLSFHQQDPVSNRLIDVKVPASCAVACG